MRRETSIRMGHLFSIISILTLFCCLAPVPSPAPRPGTPAITPRDGDPDGGDYDVPRMGAPHGEILIRIGGWILFLTSAMPR